MPLALPPKLPLSCLPYRGSSDQLLGLQCVQSSKGASKNRECMNGYRISICS